MPGRSNSSPTHRRLQSAQRSQLAARRNGADLRLLCFERNAVVACLSVETRTYPIARRVHSMVLFSSGCKLRVVAHCF